jgi:hypothetical protein
MFVNCVGCGFEGYVDDCEHQLCHGCRHDDHYVALAKKPPTPVTDDSGHPLGNDFWAECDSLLGMSINRNDGR